MERELVLISGLPGSGKSRLGASMAEKLQTSYRNVSHISLGDEVRRTCEEGSKSPYRDTIYNHLLSDEKYDPLDDDIAQHLAADALLEHAKSDLILLDGYPRSISQYEDLGHLAINEGLIIRGMLITKATQENMMIRLTKRGARPHDDIISPADAERRINIQRLPLSEMYAGIDTSADYHIPLRTISTDGPKSLSTTLGLQALTSLRWPQY